MRARHKVSGHYILDGQTPVPCTDLLEWAEWFEAADRRVAFTRVFDFVEVSTVFLGTNLNFSLDKNHPPVLFESMAFWQGHGYEQDRCCSWKSAELMHEAMVRLVSHPSIVWKYVRRSIREAFREMWDDWSYHWRELRGVPPDEFEVMMERHREKWGW